ncbi:MAG: chemotaxis protein CheA, partial [Erythrobacter sp.]
GLPDAPLAQAKIRLLRLSDGGCELLYAVREVEDAVELSEALRPVPEDPFVEAITLVAGQPVTLIDAHALFAAHGEAPQAAHRPRAVLPEGEWARTILAPLVAGAGYDIVPASEAGADTLGILFEDVYEAAEALGRPLPDKVIRLRDQPDAPPASGTIYRYDREGLLAALATARKGGAA